MKKLGLVLLALSPVAVATTPAPSALVTQQDPSKGKRDVSDFNLERGLAIDGYDPVAYFPQGGSKPAKGRKDIVSVHREVTYRFASEENLRLFKQSPTKYEPVYGGWCAYTMASEGKKVDPSPTNYLVEDGRLYLFFKGWFGNGRKAWQKEGSATMIPKAETNWNKILSETRRRKGLGS